MTFKQKLLIAIGSVILLALLFISALSVISKPPASAKSPKSTPTPQPAIVVINSSGFTPQTVSIHPGMQVIWVNEDVMPHLPAADPYPTHTSLPQLVAPKALGQKNTYSFLFTKSGITHYHDDLDPSLTGTVEVR